MITLYDSMVLGTLSNFLRLMDAVSSFASIVPVSETILCTELHAVA